MMIAFSTNGGCTDSMIKMEFHFDPPRASDGKCAEFSMNGVSVNGHVRFKRAE